jgi:hypothetical protein
LDSSLVDRESVLANSRAINRDITVIILLLPSHEVVQTAIRGCGGRLRRVTIGYRVAASVEDTSVSPNSGPVNLVLGAIMDVPSDKEVVSAE